MITYQTSQKFVLTILVGPSIQRWQALENFNVVLTICQKIFQKYFINYGFRRPYNLTIPSNKSFATLKAYAILVQEMKWVILEKQSTTTNIKSCFFEIHVCLTGMFNINQLTWQCPSFNQNRQIEVPSFLQSNFFKKSRIDVYGIQSLLSQNKYLSWR